MIAVKFVYRFREKVGLKVVKALKREDDGVTHAAVDMLAALMQVGCVFIAFNCSEYQNSACFMYPNET